MKSNDLVTILSGAVLAFVAWKVLAGSATATSTATGGIFPTQIKANTIGTDAAGWQYFNDGTAIAPNGDYYYQGSLVWKANP